MNFMYVSSQMTREPPGFQLWILRLYKIIIPNHMYATIGGYVLGICLLLCSLNASVSFGHNKKVQLH